MMYLITVLFALASCRNAAGVTIGHQQALATSRTYTSRGMSFAPPAGQNCDEPHPADTYRPIRQVLAEHPGLDGNCYYHWYANYLGDSPDYADMAKGTMWQFSQNVGSGPIATYYMPNGEVFHSHQDNIWGNYRYDDMMCQQMGWLKGQRLDKHMDKLKDREAWLKVSEEECARLPKMIEGGIDDNSTVYSIGYMADDNQRICIAADCLMQPLDAQCTKATIHDWVTHLYPKCLLGGDRINGAAGQIAWCFARACVTEGNAIKHGLECWPEGFPSWL
jgi:hypothetical protein